MRAGGWKPFWAALGATLLLLLPLAGGTVLLTRGRLRESRVQAAESQSGVAVRVPKVSDQLTVLACTSGDAPTFVLLYLNADQNRVSLLAIPAALSVPFGEGEATLADCYAAAGPARCREALNAVFSLPEDTRYIALSPALLDEIAGQFGTVRVSLAGALNADALAQTGQSAAVQELSVREAHELTANLDAAPNLSPVSAAAARAAVWDAFFRQKLELLPAALPQALRENSAALLTDLGARELYLLEETLEFLANGSAEVQSAALPADWSPADGTCAVSDASRAAVQALFNVDAAAAQSASDSAP